MIPESECLTLADKARIKKGILTGKEILNVMKEKNFQETLTKIAKSMGPYIGVLAPFTGFIMTFVPAESAELKAIKQLSEDMNNQFDQVDNSLKRIEQKIDWSQVEIKFGEIEQNIWLLDEEYQLFVASTAPAYNKQRVFLDEYDRNYNGAGTKLYQACISAGSWTKNLPQAIMHYTSNHAGDTHDFLLAVETLIMRAMRIELNYYELMGFGTIKTERENEWTKRQDELVKKFNETDQEVIALYNNQSLKDTKKFAADNVQLSNQQFSIQLYNLLTEKYYWRVWYVFIYDPLSGAYENQYADNCNGHTLIRQNGRSIMVSSLNSETDPKMDIERAKSQFRRAVCKKYGIWNIYHIWVDGSEYAWGKNRFWEMYYKIDKSFSCSLAVINSGSHPFYSAPENRVAEWKSDNCKVYMFMFG